MSSMEDKVTFDMIVSKNMHPNLFGPVFTVGIKYKIGTRKHIQTKTFNDYEVREISDSFSPSHIILDETGTKYTDMSFDVDAERAREIWDNFLEKGFEEHKN